MDSAYAFDDGLAQSPTSLFFGHDLLSSRLHQLCPTEDLTLASSLRRPFRMYPNQAKMEEEVAAMEGKYGVVRRPYIVCGQDLTLAEDVQRWTVEMNPPDEARVISSAQINGHVL